MTVYIYIYLHIYLYVYVPNAGIVRIPQGAVLKLVFHGVRGESHPCRDVGDLSPTLGHIRPAETSQGLKRLHGVHDFVSLF